MADSTGDRVLDILARVRSGDVHGKGLDKDTRQACVDYMTLEGAGTADIAKVLDVSDRTIRRDLEEIRQRRALEHDPRLTNQCAGELLAETRAAMGRMKRIARDPQTPPGVKVEAERSAVQMFDLTIARLQRLGFVATAPMQVEASLMHALDEGRAAREQIAELRRLAELASDEEREELETLAKSMERSLPAGSEEKEMTS